MSHINPNYEAVEMYEDPFFSSYRPASTHAPPTIHEPLINTHSGHHPNHLPSKSFASSKKPKWKRGLWQTFIGILALSIPPLGIMLPFLIIYPQSGSNYSSYYSYKCEDGGYSFLSPDLIAGNFTLGGARMIDISFNLVAGRGLQAILALIAYRAVTDVLMRMMELTPVSFELFSALTFQLSSVWSIWPITKSLFRLPGWRAKFIMAWVLFSGVFLVALPTMMDSMTGYVQPQDAFVQFHDGQMIPGSTYYWSNTTEWEAEMKKHGGGTPVWTCVPKKYDGYKWGFAQLWIFINWTLIGIWLLGTYSLWMDAQHNGELRRKGRTMNTYRAVVDMGEAITEVLGPNLAPYSGRELEKVLRKREASVMYTNYVDEVTGLGSVGLSTKVKTRMGKLSWDTIYGTGK